MRSTFWLTTTLASVLGLATGCSAIPLDVGNGGSIPGMCPYDFSGYVSASFEDESLNNLLEATGRFNVAARDLDSTVRATCNDISSDLGFPTAASTAQACDNAAAAIDDVMAANADVTLVVEHEPASCSVSASASASCAASCSGYATGSEAYGRCEAACQAEASFEAVCTAPETTVSIIGDAGDFARMQALIATLQENYGNALAAVEQATVIANATAEIAYELEGALSAAWSMGYTATECVGRALEAQLWAANRVQISIEASISVSASVEAGASM